MSKLAKKILVAGVSACAWATVNAADKVPTLGEVLKASGVDVTGYVDVSYTHLSTDRGSTSYRAYDTERSSFNLHTVDLSVASLPASGFGGFFQVDFGEDADVSASIGTRNDDQVDVQEAYLQYASGNLSIVGGKFATSAGAEVIESPSNTNFSRSLLFRWAIPFTHTGLRATVTPNDKFKVFAGVNNGWDVLKESATGATVALGNNGGADGKTAELGFSATPIKLLTLAASYHNGPEAGTVEKGDRSLLDVVATFNVTDALSLVVNVDRGEQDKATAASTKAKWDGTAVYVNFKLSDEWRLSARTESFNDKDGFRTGTVQKLKETTLTVANTPSKNVELRGEVRRDTSNQAMFTDGGALKKNQSSLALEAIYKF